jgi:hypothetical protein
LFGLIYWKDFIPDTVVFKVAAQYIRFCSALVHPSFVVSGFVYRVIFFGRKFCDEAWKAACRPKTKKGTLGFSHCFYSQAEPLVAYFSAVLDDHTYQTQLDMLRDCEVKSIELFSILAYLASDDRVALLPKSRAFLEKVQEIGARLYQLAEKFFTRLPEIPVFPGIFDIVEPHLARKEAARLDMERTMCTNLIRYFIDSNFLTLICQWQCPMDSELPQVKIKMGNIWKVNSILSNVGIRFSLPPCT